jgi:hypothetical protein
MLKPAFPWPHRRAAWSMAMVLLFLAGVDSSVRAADGTSPDGKTGTAPGAGSWYVSANMTSGDWSKTGLYYEKEWQDHVDCVAGGNTSLELYIKALTVHTQDLVNNGKLGITITSAAAGGGPPLTGSVTLSHYIQLHTLEWTKVTIPMADFAPVDFTAVIFFPGLPVAYNAGNYSLGVDEVRFTGGPKPVLWYGDAHPNNPICIHGIMVVNGVTVPAVEAHYVASGGVDLAAGSPPATPAAAK